MKEMCVNEKSYEVIKLLGHGKGGYSYLVTDGTKEYVLKQIHHEPCDYYQFGNKIEAEMKDYERLKEIGIPMPEMYEVDIEKENKLYYIDYECNDYMEEWNFENWGIKYWSQTKEFLEYVHKEKNC